MQKKKLVLTKTFNKKGKIAKEVSKGYNLFIEKDIEYAFRQDGITLYYYDDTLLTVVVDVYADCSGKPFDSSKRYYYYSKNKRLLKEVSILNLKLGAGEVGAEKDTILYVYDEFGRLKYKDGVYGKGTRQYFFYDENNRIIVDSVGGDHRAAAYCRVTKYRYYAHGYKELVWLNNLEYPEITEYITDEQNRVVEQRTYFHPDDEKRSLQKERDWERYFSLDGTQDYQIYDRTVTQYERDRISKTMYYYENKLTTTLLFKYK